MKFWKKTGQVFLALGVSVAILSSAAFGQQTSSQSQDTRQKLFLSIDEAINLALQNNLDISIEQFNPEIRKEDISNAEAAFDSTTTSDLSHTFNESESETSPTGISNLELGIGKRFQSGASYQLGFTMDAKAFDGQTLSSVPDPETGQMVPQAVDLPNEYTNTLSLTLAQPILRNFGTDVNTTPITIAKKNRDISVSQLREKVTDVVTEVKDSYWNLVNALANLEAGRISLQLAYDLVKINEAQVNVGTLAPIEVLQAKAQAASRKVDVTNAELTVLNAEDQLKRLLNFAEEDPVWTAAIVPTDAPSEERYSITLEESIKTALTNREQLQQLLKAIDIQEVSLNFAENQLQPELNLVGSLGVSGKDQNFGDSIGDFASFKEYGATLGANFSYPLGNRAAKSTYNKSKLQLDQTRLSQRNLEQLISVEVRVTHRNVATAYDLIGATRVARELAEEQLDAEQKKFNEGLSTNFQVLDYQDKLTQARTREALAITAYNQALANLDKATGLTLQRHNIVIKE